MATISVQVSDISEQEYNTFVSEVGQVEVNAVLQGVIDPFLEARATVRKATVVKDFLTLSSASQDKVVAVIDQEKAKIASE